MVNRILLFLFFVATPTFVHAAPTSMTIGGVQVDANPFPLHNISILGLFLGHGLPLANIDPLAVPIESPAGPWWTDREQGRVGG